MKFFFLSIFAFSFLACTSAQIDISATAWQEDLRFLQKTVHADYPFLFKKTTSEKFDKMVEELYNSIPQMQEHEIVTGFARIVSSFEYGHTVLGMRGSNFKYHTLPLNFYLFNDGLYIEGVHRDYETVLGAKVLEIGGRNVEEVMKMVRPVVPAENDQFYKAYGLGYMRIPEILHAQGVIDELTNDLSLKLEKEGDTFEQTITAIPVQRTPGDYGFSKNEGDWLGARDQSETPYYLKHLDKIYYYEYLPEEKAVYVRQSQIQDDPSENIPDFYEKVFDFVENNEVEKLILDVRLNGGGNNYKNKPVVTGIIKTEKINQTGKLFVIIGRRTFSACQNLVNELDNYTNAIFVGEPTAENINFYGDNRGVELPNSKLSVYLSFAWWQDKPQWENDDWLAPHIAVDMSFEEFRSNQDPALDAALNFSTDNFILDPMAYFTELFMAQKIDLLQTEAVRMVNDPNYRFFDFEGEFNSVGYRLLGNNQVEEAIYVFTMNSQLFPTSANTWDSLGEAYWKANQKEKAIEYYNKAISLDPDGGVGDNARKMLKQIEAGK